MFRLARRHGDVGEEQGPVPPDVMRRRTIAAGIVVAMIVAAVVGVVVATPGTPAHHGPTKAQLRTEQQRAQQQKATRRKAQAATAATTAANKKIETILTGLAHTRAQKLTRLLNEKTQATQISDAVAVQKAYHSARGKVVPLESKTSAAAPLAKQLNKLSGDYGRLAAAGRANKPATWNRDFNTIKADEKTLQSLVGKV
jgi:Tfp pilus assembly protein PilN